MMDVQTPYRNGFPLITDEIHTKAVLTGFRYQPRIDGPIFF